MSRVLCITPLKDGHIVTNEALTSLNSQTVKMDVLYISRPPLKRDTEHPEPHSCYISQAFTRNIIRDIILRLRDEGKFDYDFIYSRDVDIVLDHNDVIESCIKKLENENLDIIYINTQSFNLEHVDQDHWRMGSIVFRPHVLDKIKFRSAGSAICNCIGLRKDIESNCYKFAYLENGKSFGHTTNSYKLGDIK